MYDMIRSTSIELQVATPTDELCTFLGADASPSLETLWRAFFGYMHMRSRFN